MSLNRLGLYTVLASLGCAGAQFLTLTSMQGSTAFMALAAGLLLLIWMALLVLTFARHGRRALPLLLTVLVILAVPVLTIAVLLQCDAMGACF